MRERQIVANKWTRNYQSTNRYGDRYREKARLKKDNDIAEETIVEVFIRQLMIAIIIFLAVFIMKTVNNNFSRQALIMVKQNINYNMNIGKQKKVLHRYAENLFKTYLKK